MISKKILIPVVVLTIVGAATYGAATINAQTTTPHAGLIEAISQKFGLDKTKVQSVADEYRKTHQAERQEMMKQKMEEKLTQDVKDGKITEAQKQAIIKKLAEVKNAFNPDSVKNMTPEERKKAMDDKHAELEKWAQTQGIDPNYVIRGEGRRGMLKQGWAKP